jgi:hypothetical protein
MAIRRTCPPDPPKGEGLVTIRQAVLLAIMLIAIAVAFAFLSVEVFGGDE